MDNEPDIFGIEMYSSKIDLIQFSLHDLSLACMCCRRRTSPSWPGGTGDISQDRTFWGATNGGEKVSQSQKVFFLPKLSLMQCQKSINGSHEPFEALKLCKIRIQNTDKFNAP